jgi:hypothetical protein
LLKPGGMDDLEMLRVAISRALAEVHAALDQRDARRVARAEELTRSATRRLDHIERVGRADQRSPVREIRELMQRLGSALGALGRTEPVAIR